MSSNAANNHRFASVIAFGLGLYAFAGGCVTLVGWFAHVPRLTDWRGDGIAMFVNTAIMAIFAGAALVLRTFDGSYAKLGTRILGLFTAVIGGATLFQHMSGINLGIDTLLFQEQGGTRAAMGSGRPGPPASSSFMLLGIALVFSTRGPRTRRIVPALAIFVAAVAVLSLIGHLFDADPLFAVARFTGIAMQAASMILALALALIAIVPEHRPMSLLCETGGAGVLFRRALPVVVVLPIVLGWVLLRGERFELYDLPMGAALLVFALISVLCVLLWWCVAVVAERERILHVKEVSLREEIADRQHAEEQLREAVTIADQASRAKDDFLAALSHELRTPLTPALFIAEALESDLELPAGARDQIAGIRRNIQVEARLIDDLLDLTRVGRGKLKIDPVIVDLHTLLARALEMTETDAHSKRIAIRLSRDARENHVFADPARLQQVFWNLLQNAVKFTPADGGVVVRSFNPAPDRIAVCVEDTGAGITPEALPKIFRPFDQGDLQDRHQYGGLGLGLSISKVIIDLHGGELRAASEGRGKGATFTVELAAVPAPAAAMSSDFVVPPMISLRVLVVEDHEETLAAMSRLLERDGHRVYRANSVNQAIQQAAANECNLVISDLGLPDGTGFELMEEIHRRYGWPGIALSGYGMAADLRRSAECGFAVHLVKPVDFSQLRAAMQATMASLGKVTAADDQTSC